MRSLLSIPPLPLDQRPRPEEVDLYAAEIFRHENRAPHAWADCRREAELQLWAARCFPQLSDLADTRFQVLGVAWGENYR